MKIYLFVASLAGFLCSHFPEICIDGDSSVGFRSGAESLDFFILSLITSASFCAKPKITGYNELPTRDYKPQGKNHGNARN